MNSIPTDTMDLPAVITESLTPSSNGMTEEQKQLLIQAAGRHKNNTDFIDRGREQIAEYRKQLQEEMHHERAKGTK